jgi:RES domain-containing protein
VQTIWRLEKKRYVDTAFRGQGSLKTDGRWHHRGTQVAYASEHPAVAVLEKLVWLERHEAARASDYVLLPLRLDPAAHLETITLSDLPAHWDAFPHPEATRDIGMRWFEEERSVVLAVPSAIVPIANNYLINPFHPDFHELERDDPVSFSWNARLFQRGP